jgi:ankyrin repeat protein
MDVLHSCWLHSMVLITLATSEVGFTLETSVSLGHWHLIPNLVLAGANTSSKDKDGWTALHWAADGGRFSHSKRV